MPLSTYCELHGHYNHEESERRIADEVKNSAYEIIEKKRATYYGIAMSVRRICTAIMRDEDCVLPVSSLMVGEYGLNDLCLSVRGGERRVPEVRCGSQGHRRRGRPERLVIDANTAGTSLCSALFRPRSAHGPGVSFADRAGVSQTARGGRDDLRPRASFASDQGDRMVQMRDR